MPKVMRFRNPQKSAPQQQCAAYPTQAPAHSSPVPNPIESSPSLEAPSHVALNNSPPVHSSSAPDMPQESQTSRPRVGHESTQYWSVDVIDSEEAIKKIKVKIKEVNNLTSGERIIVHFDEQGAAYGEAQGLLAGYLGTLAVDCKLFPTNFERWSAKTGIPNTYFEECFETIIKDYWSPCTTILQTKWAASWQKVWNEFYDPAKTKDEIIRNVPIGIERDQWAQFVNYRLKPQTLELCRKNKENRKKQVIPHTGGSKPNSSRKHEMLLETRKQPGRGKIYLQTHKRKDGSFVNDAARAIGEQIEVGLTQSTIDESEVSPNDIVGKVFGPEHSGRLRCLGMAAVPTNSFRNTRLRLSNLSSSNVTASSSSSNPWQERCVRLESQVQGTLGALKAYMIMKEGRIPEELVGFFDPQHDPTDAASEPSSPLDARGSFGASNA